MPAASPTAFDHGCLSLEAIDITPPGALRHVANRRAGCLRGLVVHSLASASFGAEPERSRQAGGRCRNFGFGVSTSFSAARLLRWPAAKLPPASSFRRVGTQRSGQFALRRRRGKPFVEQQRACDGFRRGHHQRPLLQRCEYFVESRLHRTGSDGGRVLDDGRLEGGAVHGRIDAGAEHGGIDGPGAAQHETRDRDTAEEMLGNALTRLPAVVHRRANARIRLLIHTTPRTTIPPSPRLMLRPDRSQAASQAHSVIKATFS